MNSRRPGRSRAARLALRPHSSTGGFTHKAGDAIAGPLRNGSLGKDTLSRRLRYEPLEGRRLLAIVTVDTVLDLVDFNDGKTSLREAIFATNTVPGADEIRFDAALFADGPATILLKQGELAVTDALTVTGPGADLLTIDSSGNDPTPDLNNGDGSRVFSIRTASTSSQVKIVGATVAGADLQTLGAAIRALTPLTLDGVHVVHNASGTPVYSTRELRIINSRFSANETSAFASAVEASGLLHIQGSIIDHNTSLSMSAAVLANRAKVTISATQISDNVGGGMTMIESAADVANCLIENNQGGRKGGGIYMFGSSPLTLRNSTVSGNTATSFGGGIVVARSGNLIADSTISSNRAGNRGGGIYLDGASLEIRRTTITNNQTDLAGGGGMYFNSRQSSLSLDHVIIAGNTTGGTSNPSDLSRGPLTGISPFNPRHTLIGSNAGTGLTEAPVGAPDANGNLIGGPIHGPIAPLLTPLADNGGPTLPGGVKLLTHALLPGSPAIDAGDPNFQPGVQGAPEFDGRGAPFTRLAGPRIDIGAFEAQSPDGALNADFDLSGSTDGLDFLAWQRNFGKPTAATYRQGDATADGDVDASDFSVWAARFGAVSPPPLPNVAASAPVQAAASNAADGPTALTPANVDAALAYQQVFADATLRRPFRPRQVRVR